MATNYEVIVGNIGTVYSGTDAQQANDAYEIYAAKSQWDVGRAAGESVTLLVNGEIRKEYDASELE